MANPDHSDVALVAGTLHGDAKAYELLVRRYERPVRATSFAVLKDWHAAQDVAQEAFLNAFTHLRSLRNPARFGSWILTIAHNRALAVSRFNRSHQPVDVALESTAAPDFDLHSAGLFELIALLPDHERAVVMLRYVEGHDVGAIAVICNSSVGTITKQLSRAHRRLEKMIVEGERR